MIDEKKLIWAKLAEVADQYLVDIVDEQVKHRCLGAQMFGIDSSKMVDSEKIAYEVLENCKSIFTLEEMKKAVAKLSETGYKLTPFNLAKIHIELGEMLAYRSMHFVSRTSSNRSGLMFALALHKDKIQKYKIKGYSNKYWDQYRK